MVCVVEFPTGWCNAETFENRLLVSGGPHRSECFDVIFRLNPGSKVMADVAIRLLSLANQLVLTSKRVRIEFVEGQSGAMGYLDRIGFFEFLSQHVEVWPNRPLLSSADFYRGRNATLVEIARINKDNLDHNLPDRLEKALVAACGARPESEELGKATWTIFAELIQNIGSHSETPIDGYAALQFYPKSGRVSVAVSDSGKGIMTTLRPSLRAEYPALHNLSDINLLVEIFRQGLSRHGSGHGCGLKGSAAKAMKFRADLDVRLPNQRVLLTPARGVYEPNTALCSDGLPLIWGTHIAFGFRLTPVS